MRKGLACYDRGSHVFDEFQWLRRIGRLWRCVEHVGVEHANECGCELVGNKVEKANHLDPLVVDELVQVVNNNQRFLAVGHGFAEVP